MKIIEKIKNIFKRKLKTLNNIYISEKTILDNIQILQKINPWFEVFPVLKSNAYWHWIKEIAKILTKVNLKYILVDSYYEALKVSKVNKTKILIIWYTDISNLKYIDFKKTTICVYDKESIDELAKIWKKVNIHLKIDTWMNRQWIYLEKLDDFLDNIKKYKNINLEWVFTHLRDADNSDNSYSNIQENIFREATKKIKTKWFDLKYIHIDNSAGTIKWFWKDFCNSARLWLSMYWVNPLEKEDTYFEKLNWLKLALSFYSTLILKKNIKKWDKIGYNGTFEAENDMIIWLIPVWYYEWLSRKLSNNYSLYFWNEKLKILGRICMNLTIIDLSQVKNIKVLDKIEIISSDENNNNNIYKLAEKSETITYECFTRLSESIRREII